MEKIMEMEIISYNVNGIRAAIKKGLIDWIISNKYDIVCIQETKAHPEQVDLSNLEKNGYNHYWVSAEKKGYSGVLIISKVKPIEVFYKSGLKDYDSEGRIIEAKYDNFTLLNCYFPSGTTGSIRQAFKMNFLADFNEYIQEKKKSTPNLIIVGDYNIAHQEIDIHNPKSNKKSSGFLPEEREWLTNWFESGFVDAFRKINPELRQYSWWTYRMNCRAKNKGWRIDYQSVTKSISNKIQDAMQLNDVVHSDHCPVWMKIKL